MRTVINTACQTLRTSKWQSLLSGKKLLKKPKQYASSIIKEELEKLLW
ncbi:hypothetical protein AvCA_17070 [Azotobacter vinelandii CA]|uniref:Uncharacterized protein n=2 Tax=Azotobacter vinelandii TaxID=354 RepID=C1DSG5_AZOVD|nr:hypothetical protein Avin_17070 [Azotobacter vinelandii DJ]AGK16931.1 hypothetical protein AvCA_17070 [Azotobacter vinelandii CA]AGK20084.1 hypothetical protein AvCA6_17070 [Azotobacter vinelandii CA6]